VSTTTRALEEDMQDTRIIETELRREAEQSYLSYAMSVIVGRALPDVRDGLKPVHRRILYAMDELGLQPNKPHRKCARVVGEVLGKYHPHGDTAVYDALVRMVQEFSMRIPLVDGHGNFGSLDDDPPAAMRYTECRLQPFAAASLLSDLRSETVDVLPNFDNSVMEPSVLPARIPNLLINGSQGIAVGIATRIPPHNLIEVMDGLKALIENPKISVQELMKYIPGPDFPTGGEILKNEGLRDAYKTGKGSILVRAKMHIEETSKKRTVIVISELPYQTNKASLVEQIANLVDDGKITGISDIRDESDRSGMRVVIEIKQRGPTPELIMNQLQKHTAIQARFSCNMIALVDGLPKTLTLKDFLKEFLSFREKVIQKRSMFEKEKASKRLHLVEGFLIGIGNLDSVLEIIKTSKSIALAKEDLQSKFNLSSEQAEGLLGMTLRRFTSFENDKLVKEKEELEQKISEIDQLLSRKDMIHDLILKEGLEVAEKYGSKRRTEIVQSPQIELKEIDVIPNNPCIIVYSSKGYIKRMNPNTFSVQGLRGTGVAGTRLKDDESMEDLIFANDHDNLLFFTREGHVHSLPAYSIPSASRTASGTAITQLIRVNRASNIASVLPITSATSDSDVIMLTEKGQIKRTALDSFTSMSSRGLIAMKLRESDSLKFVSLCNESEDVLLTSSQGFALRFPVTSCPKLSTSAIGVKVRCI
jgi:DNA gyrase subunit A